MGVKKVVLRHGNGIDIPKKHDEVSMEYTGWLYTEDAPDHKGKQFDSSVGRGDLITPIGVGRVIRGWDEGILGSESSSAMTLGEKATLTISADYGYGDRTLEPIEFMSLECKNLLGLWFPWAYSIKRQAHFRRRIEVYQWEKGVNSAQIPLNRLRYELADVLSAATRPA